MTFEEYRQQRILEGTFATGRDSWDVTRKVCKVRLPELVKYHGKVYEVLPARDGVNKLKPLQGRGACLSVSRNTTILPLPDLY